MLIQELAIEKAVIASNLSYGSQKEMKIRVLKCTVLRLHKNYRFQQCVWHIIFYLIHFKKCFLKTKDIPSVLFQITEVSDRKQEDFNTESLKN